MEPVKFRVIPYAEIEEVLGKDFVPMSDLEEWLQPRHDILDNVDIFCENCRSTDQDIKNFDLFTRVYEDGPDVVYVLGFYLELFEFHNRPDDIPKLAEYYSKKYPNNLTIFHWNHDNDYTKYGQYVEKYPNIAVVNFGFTSKKHLNDILTSFWCINTKEYNEPKTKFAGFIGNPNNPLRMNLLNSIRQFNNDDIFHYSTGYTPDQYYKKVSECVFSLCPLGGGGGGGFSYRFFECFHLNTIPVLMVDKITYPYEDKVDWDDIIVRLPEASASDLNYVFQVLNSKNSPKMLDNIKKVREKFTLKGVQEEVHEYIHNNQPR
tara:strand:+ start:1004 stop:1960 length:957 start_codon:yes stop_codon:yes gene_type:complete